jgi:hypothetical protein
MIPATAHFIWIGSSFEWLSWAAVATAARRGGFERVILHHTDDLSRSPVWPALTEEPGVTARRLDDVATLEEAGGAKLVDRYKPLESPAARSNVLRLALLAQGGGVYLDLDTVTVRPLCSLRAEASFFCGSERIAFPATVRRSMNPLTWAGAFARHAVRNALRRSPRGVSLFRRIERHYPIAANNAVVGAEARHPFVLELLDRIVSLPFHRSQRRFALGTTLLQEALRERPPHAGVVHPPEVFYPLGPELSEHWFRPESRATLEDVLSPRTHVVHWYASVRTRTIVPQIDPAWLRREGAERLIGALLRRALLLPAPPHAA